MSHREAQFYSIATFTGKNDFKLTRNDLKGVSAGTYSTNYFQRLNNSYAPCVPMFLELIFLTGGRKSLVKTFSYQTQLFYMDLETHSNTINPL